MNRILSIALLLTMPLTASALNVFACEPEWGSLTTELAGPDLDLTIATTAYQDPHSVQAKPSLIAAMRRADIVVCTGAELEIGWLPLLLRRAGNGKIQVGSPGNFSAADYVRRLEIPKAIDRSQGDVHAQGNPHIHLHPRNISRVADALAERLTVVDPANAQVYQARLAEFQERWDAAREQWDERAIALSGMRLAAHRTSFSYLANWLDLDVAATLEAKPGIPPSGAQLSRLLEQLTPNPPIGVIRTPYENEKPSHWLSQRLDVPEIVLPFTVGGADEVTDLFSLFDVTLQRLEAHLP